MLTIAFLDSKDRTGGLIVSPRSVTESGEVCLGGCINRFCVNPGNVSVIFGVTGSGSFHPQINEWPVINTLRVTSNMSRSRFSYSREVEEEVRST